MDKLSRTHDACAVLLRLEPNYINNFVIDLISNFHKGKLVIYPIVDVYWYNAQYGFESKKEIFIVQYW